MFQITGMERMMECGHPFWKNKPAYANVIINHNNSTNGRFPVECPLKVN